MNKNWIFTALLYRTRSQIALFRKWKAQFVTVGIIGLILLTGCSLPSSAPLPTPTLLVLPTISPALLAATPIPIPPTAVPTATFAAPAPGALVDPVNFCADGQVPALISSLKTALQTSDGPLLASLVHPTHGMEVRYYRDGRIVTYDQTHAKFLFWTTFQVNWGNSAGSGKPTVGAFHDVIVPALLKVFNTEYTLTCNQVQVGGASYVTTWPYTGINYYSVYFPGTDANSKLDWHTWLVGVDYAIGKPYLYALMQFEWEP